MKDLFTARMATDAVRTNLVEAKSYVIEKIQPHIKKAAEDGLTECVVQINVAPAFEKASLTNIQHGAMRILQKSGFNVQYNSHGDHFYPNGRNDSADHGAFKSWCFFIRWPK